MNGIYDPSIRKMCSYCQHGTKIPAGEDVICPYKGLVSYDYVCRKYLYDPTRRIRKRTKKMQASFDETDFSLGPNEVK